MAMVGAKIGTKAFAEIRPQDVMKNDGPRNLTDKQLEQLGGENIGEVLNKVADPNWVDPAKKVRTVGSDKLDKDAFMKLMLTQMKNQDPTNPLKSHEMAAQMAQFSSLEQLQNVNTTLDQIKNGQKPTETYQSLNFIGKAVAGDSSKITRAKGDKLHDFSFNLPEDAKKVTISVKNGIGETVRKVDLPNLKAGENSWRWNGETERGEPTTVGDYKFVIEAETGQGKKLDVKTDFEGIISGVNYSPEGPVLLIGNQSIKLQDVKKIVDPSQLNLSQPLVGPGAQNFVQPDQRNGQNLKNQTSGPLKMSNGISDDKSTAKGAPDVDEKPIGNVMNSVPMSQDLLTKLEKETKAQ